MTEYELVRSMVLNFRLSELQNFLVFAGQSRFGRKSELQTRALELIRDNPHEYSNKVKELSSSMYKAMSSATSVNPYSPNYVGDSGVTMRETRSRTSHSHSNTNTTSTTTTATTSKNVETPSLPPATTTSGSTSTITSSVTTTSSTTTTSVGPTSAATGSSGYLTGLPTSNRISLSDFIPLSLSGASSSLSNPYQPYSSGFTGYGTIDKSGFESKYLQEKSSSSHLMYPTCPDVQLRRLPFYDTVSVLLKPSSLQPKGSARFQEQTFSFHLTPTQATAIASSCFRDSIGRSDYKKQIQLRFSLLETSCEQEDNFPQALCVKVNGRLQQLPNALPTNKPGVEPKRPPKPINITQLCKLSSTVPNCVDVSWTVETGRGYTLSVYFVDKLSSTELLKRLKNRGMRNSDYTRAVIKDKLNDKDTEIATTSCKVSLACPLGKMRMTLPCRASTCDHLQCFDANLYLQMNEKKPKWLCPVCNKPALYENLLLDGFFSEVLMSLKLPRDEHEIVLHQDASWEPTAPKKDPTAVDPQVSLPKVETFNVDDDDSEPMPSTSRAWEQKKPATTTNQSIDCITLDSDSEEEVTAPPTKRPRLTAFLDDDDDSSTSSVLTPSASPPPGSVLGGMLPPPPRLLPTAAPTLALPRSSSPPLICLDDD